MPILHEPRPADEVLPALRAADLTDLLAVQSRARTLASSVGHLVQATRSAQANPNSVPAQGWLETCYAQYLSACDALAEASTGVGL